MKSLSGISMAVLVCAVSGYAASGWLETGEPNPRTPKTAVTKPTTQTTSLLTPHVAAVPPPAPSVTPTAECQPAAAPDQTALRRLLAEVVRTELREVLAFVNAEAEKARHEDAQVQEILTSPENREAYQGAHDLVQYALAAGRWTDEDAQALQAAFAHLTSDQIMEVSAKLIPAMNNEEIVVETTGPPF